MARPSTADVALYRAALRDVNTLAQRDLLTYWRQFDLADAVKVRDGLMDVLPGIIDTHHLSAATVAADWYDLQRYQLGAKGRFRAVMADAPADGRGAVMARWGVGPMFSSETPAVAEGLVLSKISGALQRVVTDGARQTITGSTARDPGRVGWVRVTSGGCEFCEMLAGRGAVYSADSATFESHDHCLLPGTVVTGPRFEAAFRRLYQGEVVVVSLTGGGELAITPNHPVLTDRGWVDPHLLNPGDQIAHRTGAEPELGRIPDEQDVPTLIEDAWRAYSVDGLTSMPVAPEDFHGDGVGTQGKVDVVTGDGFLAEVFDPRLAQHRLQSIGAGAGATSVAASLLSERDLGRMEVAHRNPAHGIMRSGSSGAALFRGQLGRSDQSRRSAASPRNARLLQPSLHDAARDAEVSGYGQFGFAADVAINNAGRGWESIPSSGPMGPGSYFNPPSTQVFGDRLRAYSNLGRSLLQRLAGGVELRSVVDVRRIDYSGHVYNLQTSEGWFSASSVVVSNCRCDAVIDVS